MTTLSDRAALLAAALLLLAVIACIGVPAWQTAGKVLERAAQIGAVVTGEGR